MKCTQKSPDRRYLNCRELINDLKHSLIDPEGSFVNMSLYGARTSDETVLMTDSELDKIKHGKYNTDGYDYDDDDYDDDYDDDDYDDDDDDDRPLARNKKEGMNKDTKKIMKILMIVAAVILAFALIFTAGKALGLFKSSPGNVVEEEEQRKVKVPDVKNKTVNIAKDILSDKKLGYKVVGEVPSDDVKEGHIISQEPAADEKVSVNTEVQLIVSTGKETVEIKVPDVKGEDEDDAQKILVDLKLIPEFEYEFSDTVDEGKVISTSPKSGAKITEGKKVTVVISKGSEKKEVPSLVGSSKEDAETMLSNEGLKGKVTEEYSSEVEKGYVISQDTEAGSKVKEGTTVAYVVSKGPKIEMVTVPSLKGLTESDAGKKITSAGLLVGSVSYEVSDTTPGYCISQSISSGSSVEKGTSIDIVISKAAPPPEPVEPEKPATPEKPANTAADKPVG